MSQRYTRCAQEVEGLTARRSVHHHQIETLVAIERIELLGRHVFLTSREPAGHVLVERVVEDPLRLLRRARVLTNHVVEGLSGVEHHRPQLAVTVDGNPSRIVAEAISQTEGIGQAPSRVDGDHHDLAPPTRRLESERGRSGGLAHSTRTTAHDDRRIVHERGEALDFHDAPSI